MWVLVMVLVGYGSNGSRLRIWEGGWDGLPFQLQTFSSETTTCNTPILWDWAIRNKLLWALFTLSILWGRRERLKHGYSSQDSIATWPLDGAWID